MSYFNPQPKDKDKALDGKMSLDEYKAMKSGAKKKNKYSAKKQTFRDRKYDSTLESEKAIDLAWQQKAGLVKEVKPQHKFDLRVNEHHICNYYIDFRVVNEDKTVDYIEVKGMPTDMWRTKWNLTIALFDQLTKGENARLFLNEKCVLQSFKKQ